MITAVLLSTQGQLKTPILPQIIGEQNGPLCDAVSLQTSHHFKENQVHKSARPNPSDVRDDTSKQFLFG